MRSGETGHVWQNRFYSCPLGEAHQWDALRYVELNPVRAGLVEAPVDWPWSSAAAHTSGVDERGILEWSEWSLRWNPATWSEALEQGVGEAALLERIRAATRTGQPAGSEDFVRELEASTHRTLRPRKRGPKVQAAGCNGQAELGFS